MRFPKPWLRLWKLLFPLAAMAGFFFLFLQLIGGISERSGEEGARLVRESLHRAAVQCYALEAAYPVSLEELTSRYGLTPDESRYAIYYDYIAANLLPDITVIEIQQTAAK